MSIVELGPLTLCLLRDIRDAIAGETEFSFETMPGSDLSARTEPQPEASEGILYDCPPGYRRNEVPGDCNECGFYHDDDDEGCGLPSGYKCKGCGFKRIEQPQERRFRGVGELERSGYIPDGSAEEREQPHENLCDCGRAWVHTDQGLLCPVCMFERARNAESKADSEFLRAEKAEAERMEQMNRANENAHALNVMRAERDALKAKVQAIDAAREGEPEFPIREQRPDYLEPIGAYLDRVQACHRMSAHAAALRAENANLKGAMTASDERLEAAGGRVGINSGCDTPDHMADEILALRARVEHEVELHTVRMRRLVRHLWATRRKLSTARSESAAQERERLIMSLLKQPWQILHDDEANDMVSTSNIRRALAPEGE